MRFHLVKQLAATWSGQNKKLGSGILGFESDTGLAKIGDGATAWNSLRYLTDLPIVTALPTAAAGLRGRMVVMNNGSGNADTVHVCRKAANGSYSWVAVTTS